MQRENSLTRQIHDLVQGTPEWNQFRLEHDGASEAAASLGLSKKTKRSELIRMKATGLGKEFSDWVQEHILDYGHQVEAMARPIVEQIIGDELYPVTCSLGRLSASCDGLTMSEAIAFEHKQWAAEWAASVAAGVLPEEHAPQCQQILMVTGAEKLIFVVSDGTAEKMVHMWVYPDTAWFDRINAGWEQFNLDAAAYVPVEIVEPTKAAAIADLPVVTVQVRGELTMCNLKDITPQFDKFLAEVKLVLKTDDDFALAEEQAKTGRAAAKQCQLTAKAVVDQMASVAEVTRSLEEYAAKFNAMALQQEKAVKEQKDARRAAAKLEREKAYSDHLTALNTELHPLRLIVADAGKPQFAEVMKNQRTLASLYNKLDTELARVKIAANEVATNVRAKLAWMQSNHAEYDALFPPVLMQQLVAKPTEDFQLAVTTRVDAHKVAEKAKEDALRAQIAAQEQAKAEAAAAKKLADERQADADRQAAEQVRVAAETKRQLEAQAAQLAAQRQADEQRAQQAAQAERPTTASAAIAQANALAEQARLTDLADAQAHNAVAPMCSAAGADLFGDSVPVPAAPPSLKLGQINERIAPLAITVDGLRALGFEPAATDRASKLYHEIEFPRMCAAMMRHISAAQAKFAA